VVRRLRAWHPPVRQWVLSVPKRLRYLMQRGGLHSSVWVEPAFAGRGLIEQVIA
jgi:hypothetical protein